MLIHYSKYLVLTLEKLACHVFGNKYVFSNIFIIFKYVVIKFDFIFWAPASQLCWIMYNLEKCNSNVLEFSIPQIKRKQKRNQMCFNSMQSSSITLYSFSFDLTWLSFVQCQNTIYCIQIKNELLWKLQIYYCIPMYLWHHRVRNG